MEPCCKRSQANATMKAFLTAHGRQLDPSLPDGNCLFRSLCKQMTGDPTKHAELRELLINFISQNSHIFGRGWTIGNCSLKDHLAKVAKLGQFGSHAEIKAAASLCQKPVYVATDSLTVGKCTWTVFHPFPLAIVNMHMVNTNFITQPKPWYEIAYTSGCHYDGISPIRTDCQVTPPPLTGYALSETIIIS